MSSPAEPAPSRAPRRGVLIYNPTAGQRDRHAAMHSLIDRMRAEGIELANAPTRGPGHATRIVHEHLPEKPDVVAVCGGDGTVSEAAAALLGTDVPLAIIPGGTSNVLAVELGIPFDVTRACRLILDGEVRTVRAAVANDRPFLLMAGIGLDARVMGKMSLFLKRWFGRAGIFVTAVAEFLKYEFPRLDVEVDGTHHAATFAVVANSKHYAGDWIVAPDASAESDTLEVLIFDSRRRIDLLHLFLGMQGGKGAHLERGIARIVRGRAVRITSLESYAVEVQVDGDCVLETPVVCRVAERRLRVLAPKR
ncbi:MAG TPA: diacylglycerol kinase family protein [Thermoanaerobaculia bacterium]|nr:diacylglycerol kinase family protein [Thermoanaerobaculia bacterium]